MIDWWGPILAEYYGATEGHGITVITPPSGWRSAVRSGKAALGVVHICDDDGDELPAGEIGAVYFERDGRPFEYHNDPEKTTAVKASRARQLVHRRRRRLPRRGRLPVPHRPQGAS